MNTQNNAYTFIYSIILVVVVATLLAVISLSLKDRQNANIRNEKMQNILSAVNINVPAAEAEVNFEKYITDQFIVNSEGERVDGVAFDVDVSKEFKKSEADRLLPIYVADVEGETKYILSLYGRGLWGPIWSYMALDSDKNTVYGVFFDHSGETPGLGAEITNPAKFGNFFAGKKVYDAEGERILKVEKGATSKGLGATEVDAISGGTLTSNGVEEMLGEYFGCYRDFLASPSNDSGEGVGEADDAKAFGGADAENNDLNVENNE